MRCWKFESVMSSMIISRCDFPLFEVPVWSLCVCSVQNAPKQLSLCMCRWKFMLETDSLSVSTWNLCQYAEGFNCHISRVLFLVHYVFCTEFLVGRFSDSHFPNKLKSHFCSKWLKVVSCSSHEILWHFLLLSIR